MRRVNATARQPSTPSLTAVVADANNDTDDRGHGSRGTIFVDVVRLFTTSPPVIHVKVFVLLFARFLLTLRLLWDFIYGPSMVYLYSTRRRRWRPFHYVRASSW